jgi:2-dehydro-3-deoxyphosphooctonate aldolase (KDO 8-P synthase)
MAPADAFDERLDANPAGCAMSRVDIAGVHFGNDLRMAVISGPCQLETATHAQMIAGKMAETCKALGLGYVFKASFDKANRTSCISPRGPGLPAGVEMLAAVRALGVPVITDVHQPWQCAEVAMVADAIQIPALLARQTDLLTAAGATGLPVLIKKGQGMAPAEIGHAAAKVASTGNRAVIVAERGSSWGPGRLVVDFTGLADMGCYPRVMDATHAAQRPAGLGGCSGGSRDDVRALALAAVAVGVAGVFLEVHETPSRAPSDGPVAIRLGDMPELLGLLAAIDAVRKA